MKLDNDSVSATLMFAGDTCTVKVTSATSFQEEKEVAKSIKYKVNNHAALVEALDLMCDEFRKIAARGDNKDYCDTSVLKQAEDLLESLK